ncbi:amino acid ABC transporter permease [Pandoraea terrae]|uniref:Amino acid ABC transporter permease n=1 Tax=Pandoraea terrae TaxID=1537710 RepID=A0A5E4V9S9_9BURK|nr:amino acid ABC transporter permease [Pandoraea terrae]VVE08851.1 amino acid ABC transporter permease [Pandoraea terrae]
MSATISDVFQPIPPRPAPERMGGVLAWIRLNLFSNVWNSVATLAALALIAYGASRLLSWGLLNAVFAPNVGQCQAARGSGACWGVVSEKFSFIVFGRYPMAERWRSFAATALLIALLAASCMRPFWRRWLVGVWIAVVPIYFILMRGGMFSLAEVPTDLWGGLPLTVMLAAFGIVLAFPIAVLVALGRRSKLPAVHSLCVVYIELIRGVPLISVLFMASFMFPLFLPANKSPDVLVRVLAGITLFSAAYLAEVVRGGLQAIPKGQVEAADTLGLSYWQTQRKIVLPQALTLVVPNIVSSFIGIFKDTSLVTIVSLYELTGSMELALDSDAAWRPFKIEGYLFIVLIYFLFCFSMSRYSLWIEKQVKRSKAR